MEDYYKARYARLKENGICVYCHKEKARMGRTTCVACAKKVNQMSKDKRDGLLKLGFCMACGKNRVYCNDKLCPDCLEKRKQSFSKIPKVSKEKSREYARAYRKRRKQQGKCQRCGNIAMTGKTICYQCSRKNIEKGKLINEGCAYRSERPSEGRCYFCGEKTWNGTRVCEKHYKTSVKNLPSVKNNDYWKNSNKLIFISKAK